MNDEFAPSAWTSACKARRAARAAFREAIVAGGRRSPAARVAFVALRFARTLCAIALDWSRDEQAARLPPPEVVAARYRSEVAAAHAALQAQTARRRARYAENARAMALGRCPRCIGGYIPNMPVDGGVCYRCGGSGRA